MRTFEDASGRHGSVRATVQIKQGDLKQIKRLGEGGSRGEVAQWWLTEDKKG